MPLQHSCVAWQGRRLLEEASKLLAENRGSLGAADIAAEVSSAGLLPSRSPTDMEGFKLRPGNGLPREVSTPRFARAAAPPVRGEAHGPIDGDVRPVKHEPADAHDQLVRRQSSGLGPQAQARVIAAGVRKAVEVRDRLPSAFQSLKHGFVLAASWLLGCLSFAAEGSFCFVTVVASLQTNLRWLCLTVTSRCCAPPAAQESTTSEVALPEKVSLADLLNRAAGSLKVCLSEVYFDVTKKKNGKMVFNCIIIKIFRFKKNLLSIFSICHIHR